MSVSDLTHINGFAQHTYDVCAFANTDLGAVGVMFLNNIFRLHGYNKNRLD
jgi:hypothetical protein